MGRPKVTLDEHMDKVPIVDMGYTSWQQLISKEMGEGASRQEIKALLNMSNDLFARFLEDEPLFAEAIKRGDELAEAWWIGEGRRNLKTKEFSPVLWYMNMKNRFGWRDKQEVEHSGHIDRGMTEEQLDAIIARTTGKTS